MKNSTYYIAPVGDWTHDLPHTVASNMVKVSPALNHSANQKRNPKKQNRKNVPNTISHSQETYETRY